MIYKYLTCYISKGGFSEEKIVRLVQSNGEEIALAVPVDYLFDRNCTKITKEQLTKKSESITGVVKCQIIESNAIISKVSIPLDHVIEVPTRFLMNGLINSDSIDSKIDSMRLLQLETKEFKNNQLLTNVLISLDLYQRILPEESEAIKAICSLIRSNLNGDN